MAIQGLDAGAGSATFGRSDGWRQGYEPAIVSAIADHFVIIACRSAEKAIYPAIQRDDVISGQYWAAISARCNSEGTAHA